MSTAALVGVTTYYAESAWGPWHRPAAVLPAAYIELVAAAGGRPLLLPPTRGAPQGPGFGADEVVDALDALVLVGGGDLDAAAYGEPEHPNNSGVDRVRDESERAVLEAALRAELPVLAICRGLQLLNVLCGGSLIQHLPDLVGHDGHQPAPGAFDDVEISTVPGSRLSSILGPADTVRCSHHQAVERPGAGLTVSARSVGEDGSPGIIEALELDDAPFVVGVQWHPEESGDQRLFDALVAAAKPSERKRAE